MNVTKLEGITELFQLSKCKRFFESKLSKADNFMRIHHICRLLLIGLLLGWSAFEAEAQVELPDTPEKMEIQLVPASNAVEFDDMENPFEGAEVLLSDRKTFRGKELENFKTITGASGKASIPIKELDERTLFHLTISKKGLYIPKLRLTGGQTLNALRIPVYPVIQLKGSLRLSDEDKKVDWSKEKIGIQPKISFNLRPFYPVAPVEYKEINEDGTWSIEIPFAGDAYTNLIFGGKEVEMKYFFLGHNSSNKNHIPINKVEEYDWDLTVKPSTKIYGFIADHLGSPRQGVKLKAQPVNRDMYALSQTGMLSIYETDQNGNYEFSFPFPDGFKLAVQDGVAHFTSKSFESNNTRNEWNVEFPEPRSLILKAEKDGEEDPEDVKFYISLVDRMAPMIREAMAANEDGIYEWKEAPKSDITISAYAKGQTSPLKKQIPASLANGSTIKFLFRQPFGIDIEVLDSISLQPIENPKILKGTAWNIYNTTEIVQWVPYTNAKLVKGRLVYKSTRQLPESQGHQFVIHAPGYLPYDTGLVPAYGSLKKDIKLDRGSGPNGQVIDSSGESVTDCKVFLEGLGTQYISPGPTLTHTRTEITLTSKNGRFELPAILPECQVIALSEKGFCRKPWNSKTGELELQLEPFKTIRGILKKSNGEPWANQRIKVDTNVGNSYNNLRTQHDAFVTTTDEGGNFSIEGLPPIELVIRHGKRVGISGFISGQSQVIPANWDSNVPITVGGKDWQVKGKLDLPEDSISQIDRSMSYATITEAAPVPPKRIRENPNLYTLWRRSNKYKNLINNRSVRVGNLQEDGTIIFENVPEGKYLLNVRLNKQKDLNARTLPLHNSSKTIDIKPGIIQTIIGNKNQIDIGKIK